jgi:MFS family permease
MNEHEKKDESAKRSFRREHLRDLFNRSSRETFTRMARMQVFTTAGDAMFTVALAGTIFFAAEPTEARWRVALYLALTIAPFIVAAPFIGPLLDRVAGGRKWTLFAAAAARAFLAFMVLRDLNSIWFYPEVFLFLVMGRVHMISKSAIVPSTVPDEVPLVTANSFLAFLATIAATVFGGVGLLTGMLAPELTLTFSMTFFGLAAWQAWGLPNVAVAPDPPTPAETFELNSDSIKAASQALTVLRGLLGFFIFFAAFNFKSTDKPLWWLGVVAVAAQAGYFVGVIVAPWLRRKIHEQQTIMVTLVMVSFTSFMAFILLALKTVGPVTSLVSVAGFAFSLGACSSVAKLSFDALVQNDAPDGNRGRMFSAFETRFQIVWAGGALIAVIVPFPDLLALGIVVLLSVVAVVGYSTMRHLIKKQHHEVILQQKNRH